MCSPHMLASLSHSAPFLASISLSLTHSIGILLNIELASLLFLGTPYFGKSIMNLIISPQSYRCTIPTLVKYIFYPIISNLIKPIFFNKKYSQQMTYVML